MTFQHFALFWSFLFYETLFQEFHFGFKPVVQNQQHLNALAFTDCKRPPISDISDINHKWHNCNLFTGMSHKKHSTLEIQTWELMPVDLTCCWASDTKTIFSNRENKYFHNWQFSRLINALHVGLTSRCMRHVKLPYNCAAYLLEHGTDALLVH